MKKLFTHASMLDHTRYYYRKMYAKNFIVNEHHVQICDALDKVMRGEITKLMINIAPRYGKTELAVKNFISKGFAINPAAQFIHLSYSDDLALGNSAGTQAIVTHESYREINPTVRISKSLKGKKKWGTTAGGVMYATSTGGQVTGFGAGTVDTTGDGVVPDWADTTTSTDPGGFGTRPAHGAPNDEIGAELDAMFSAVGIDGKFGGALIIDDPIKPEDADSEQKRERVNQRYDSTIKNRVNSRKTPIIIIMQRLHERDLCGYLLENEPGEWTVLSIPCIQFDEEGKERALWPHKHTLEELHAERAKNPIVFERQYMQDPQPIEGLLYGQPWKVHFGESSLPYFRSKIRKAYIDTADTGNDYLCAITYLETPAAVYILDVLYTQKPMEYTEPQTAKLLLLSQVDVARFESNNGGRSFARTVEKLVREEGNRKMIFKWFHQGNNKHVRIFNHSASVQNMIYLPNDWATRWPMFYKHVTTYRANGKNPADDAEDVLTGIIEFFGKDKTNNASRIAAAVA